MDGGVGNVKLLIWLCMEKTACLWAGREPKKEERERERERGTEIRILYSMSIELETFVNFRLFLNFPESLNNILNTCEFLFKSHHILIRTFIPYVSITCSKKRKKKIL